MNFRYPRHRIQEFVAAAKALTTQDGLEISVKGEHSAEFDAQVDLMDGAFADLRYLGHAARRDEPRTYDSSFLIDQQRVRGVGFCPVERKNIRAKWRIPAGWHQNICDPNMATDHPEWNRHEPLPDFNPSDFRDFVRKTAALWNIDVGWEDELL